MAVRTEYITELGVKIPPRWHMTEEEFAQWCDEDVKAEWIAGTSPIAESA